jgi:putative copper export protein
VLSAILIFFSRSGLGLRVLLVVSGQLLSYFLVYLVTPNDLGYIVFTTFDRLVLQIAPSVLLLLAVALHPYIQESSAARTPRQREAASAAAVIPGGVIQS